ncbi:hypothetical protein EYE42_14080 [Paracoccus subflavus]|uniref:Chromosome partition protein Smc n=1 Tax=Paracoccus subflavus TaxID=2528244 RepID=A0A4Q9FZQ7_9RHOB|nr:hypothetical protein [Paracoccus subflavus]TBN37770.1 hypothetical protein EYE42_14080 [Paracoccus subflavus]
MRIGYRIFLAGLAVACLSSGRAGAQAPDDDLSRQAHSLRQIISTMEAEAAELEPRLAAARQQLTDLNGKIEQATAQMDAVSRDLAEGKAAEAEMRAAITQATEERNRQQADLETARREMADAQARTESARAALAQITGDRDRRQAELDAAAKELDDLESRTQAARAALAEITQRHEAMQADLVRSQDLAAQIAEQENRSRDLADAVRRLTAELTALTRVRDAALAEAQPPSPQPAGTEAEPDAAASPAGLQARDSRQVDAALAAAPALPQGGDRRGQLRTLLVEGHCVTDALAQVQNPINRQTLLVLVGRLGGC